jgi:FlaA1/EpsC-like NDP-sugar epimerase
MRVALDLGMFVSAFVAAYLLRFDFVLSPSELNFMLIQLPVVVLMQYLALELFGGRSFLWRHTAVEHLTPFFYAGLLCLCILLAGRLGLSIQAWRVPISISIVDTILAFGGTFGIRILRRTVHQKVQQSVRRKRTSEHPNRVGKSVLLIGAGQAGLMAVREIRSQRNAGLDIKGFVDDDPTKQKRVVLDGIKVLGTTSDLPSLVREMDIHHVVITIARASGEEIRRIVEICEQVPVKARIIPGLYELLDGSVDITRIRDLQIEDLLGRPTVALEEESLTGFLAGETVMVTGAGGSIGSELTRQIARFEPQTLLLVERSEFALFNISRELQAAFPEAQMVSLIADVGDETRMRAIFKTYSPRVVFHAAAHKHVPLMESNAIEAIKNNALATYLLAQLAGEYRVLTFVLISTDKAVHPISMMGASKRVAELVMQDLDHRHLTRYVAVRFGNVIGSAGSVIPIFREQIRKGGPVTVTDKRMKRYFMTIPEAAQLVLQAGAMSGGGEVFVLDMGKPISIEDLARQVISLSGFKHDEIKIVETGIRPGEKLYEELHFTKEEVVPTRHPKIFINRLAALDGVDLSQALEQMAEYCRREDEGGLRRYLNTLLPGCLVAEEHLGSAVLAPARYDDAMDTEPQTILDSGRGFREGGKLTQEAS